MLCSHFELLCKALEHGPFRLPVELHYGLSEIAWLVERGHANADVNHKFFIHWTR